MFKTWHIFVFSLIPLALVLAGVIVGSIYFSGGDSEAEAFPTPQAGSNAGPPPTPVPGATAITLVAQNLLFNTRSLTAAAGQPVQMTLDNKDATVLHNFALYSNASATQVIYKGDLFAGPEVRTFTFNAPPTPGNYFFRCDVHPDTMTGTFTAR